MPSNIGEIVHIKNDYVVNRDPSHLKLGGTEIEAHAHAMNDEVVHVHIEDVKSIGNNAFDCCENLESVYISGTVENIGDEAFIHCSNLKVVVLGEGIRQIGERAFLGCNIENLHIPEGVEHVGLSAFAGNKNMASAYIPTTLSLIVASREYPHLGSVYSNYFKYSGGRSNTLKISIPHGIAIGNSWYDNVQLRRNLLEYQRYHP